MNTEPVIRSALADVLGILSASSDTPYAVNDYERDNENAYLAPDGVTMRGFYLTNADEGGGAVETRRPLDLGGSIECIRAWTIVGFWEFSDAGASEKVFRVVLADILNALTPRRSLNGGSITNRLPSILAFHFARFGSRRVHVGTIGLETRSEEQLSPPT